MLTRVREVALFTIDNLAPPLIHGDTGMRHLLTVLAVTVLSAPMTATAQSVDAVASAQVAAAIRGQPEIRVLGRGAMGHISMRSPSVQGTTLVGRVQTGTFSGQATFDQLAIPLGSIQEVLVRDGSYWALGLGVGALGGLVLAGSLQQVCQNDPQCEGPTGVGYPAIYAMSIGSFALMGLIGGALKPRWSTVYSRGTPIVAEPYGAVSGTGSLLLGMRLLR